MCDFWVLQSKQACTQLLLSLISWALREKSLEGSEEDLSTQVHGVWEALRFVQVLVASVEPINLPVLCTGFSLSLSAGNRALDSGDSVPQVHPQIINQG